MEKLIATAALRLRMVAISFVFLAVHSQAMAMDPQRLVLLQDGEISASLQFEDIEDLPQVTFETGTVWTDGKVKFSGVSLRKLLEHHKLEGSVVRLKALNDYAVDIPTDEIEEVYPIIAIRLNDSPMRIRDKGPYWLVYPYDNASRYQNETIYARSIWQLVELEVLR